VRVKLPKKGAHAGVAWGGVGGVVSNSSAGYYSVFKKKGGGYVRAPLLGEREKPSKGTRRGRELSGSRPSCQIKLKGGFIFICNTGYRGKQGGRESLRPKDGKKGKIQVNQSDIIPVDPNSRHGSSSEPGRTKINI